MKVSPSIIASQRAKCGLSRWTPAIKKRRGVAAVSLFAPYKNATERRYADQLEQLRRAGAIQFWGYQKISMQLGKKRKYTPDFLVIKKTGEVEIHETKGFERQTAVLRFVLASELLPCWKFLMIVADGNGWAVTRELLGGEKLIHTGEQ